MAAFKRPKNRLKLIIKYIWKQHHPQLSQPVGALRYFRCAQSLRFNCHLTIAPPSVCIVLYCVLCWTTLLFLFVITWYFRKIRIVSTRLSKNARNNCYLWSKQSLQIYDIIHQKWHFLLYAREGNDVSLWRGPTTRTWKSWPCYGVNSTKIVVNTKDLLFREWPLFKFLDLLFLKRDSGV